jgi:Ca2+-binding EF-hand superfamily protein
MTASFGLTFAALAWIALPAWAQGPDRKAGDIPGPIDSIDDLEDTGRMLFRLADENLDGKISKKEAINAGNLLVGGFFFRADQNGDGKVSQEEARHAREAFLSARPWLRYAVETAKNPRSTQGNSSRSENPIKFLAAGLDTNNDKELEATELRQGVNDGVQALYETADTNHDDQLTSEELNGAAARFGKQLAQATFQRMDSDNNGQISQAEFEKALVEPARIIFGIADLNHDGQISKEEAQSLRDVVASKVRLMNQPEPPNSLKRTLRSAAGSPTQPGSPTSPPATGNTNPPARQSAPAPAPAPAPPPPAERR